MTWPGKAPPEPERMFIIEFSGAGDALARLLGIFALHDCRIRGLGLEPLAESARLSVHSSGLDDATAERLRRRLAALALVQGVSLGWRAAPHAQDAPRR